jgi:hypothetical protein
MKSRTKLLLLIFGVILVLGTVEVFTGSTLVHELINMRHAGQYLPILSKKLDAYPEFRQLKPCVSDISGGVLAIDGYLRTEAELKHLREIVESTKPPVRVIYNLQVVTNGADRLIIWTNN